MSDFKCFVCDGILMKTSGNKYFTYFTCDGCARFFCLANDKCDSWSWLKWSKAGNPQYWVDCTDAMHKKNPHVVPIKVLFT